MKISIMKLIFLVQKQIFEKCFQILCCFVNAFLQIRIICTDKCISEIPRIFRKNIIGRRKAQCPQIFNEEHCRCSRIEIYLLYLIHTSDLQSLCIAFQDFYCFSVCVQIKIVIRKHQILVFILDFNTLCISIRRHRNLIIIYCEMQLRIFVLKILWIGKNRGTL
ncbi:MAG: hypothetical protein EGS62_13070 [Ruminococcus sp.]|nr:hypothetical protein [Ruminococcus sp.]